MTWHGFKYWLSALQLYPARFADAASAYRYYRILFRVPRRWLGKRVCCWHWWYWQFKARVIRIIARDSWIAIKVHWMFRKEYWNATDSPQ